AEQRARYRAARKRLRRRVREERAYQARANEVSGNLWNDILGADPEDYREGRELGSTDATGRPGPAPARIAGPSNDPEETGREPDSRPGEDSGHPPPDQPDDPGGAGTEGTR
ncbi:Na(+)/H(+) antiporter subunit C, partial [Streptomyces ardesiacus]